VIVGSTSIPGEVFLDGEDRTFFAVESGERYRLGGGLTGSCPSPPTTVLLR